MVDASNAQLSLPLTGRTSSICTTISRTTPSRAKLLRTLVVAVSGDEREIGTRMKVEPSR